MLSFPWNREETVSISFSRSAREDTSHTDPLTLKPCVFHSCKHLSSSDGFLEHAWTVTPNRANSSTMAYLFNQEKANK